MTFIDTPTQPLLEIPDKLQLMAWQNRSSSAPAWWNTYLNQVCLQTVLPWLQADYDPTAESELDQAALEGIWQIVNGTAVSLAAHRVILIPDKTIDTREFRVPQEWVDIPSWAGDYYLAAQVNPDDASVLIWGYTTHEQLKSQGNYDERDRTYTLDSQALIRDFAVFGVTQAVCPSEVTRAKIMPLPSVSKPQAEQLVQRLSNPAIFLPRLEIPFQLWGALLEESQWRQQLGDLRLGRASATLTKAVTHLNQWLQNAFEESWQTLETLLGNEPALAYQFRQTVELIAPALQRIKVLELEEQTMWLFVGLEPERDERLSIRVLLRSTEQDSILPTGVTLTLLSDAGDVVQCVEARDRDNGIQLKRFRCSTGTRFSLQLSIDSLSLTEDFMV